MIITRFPPSPTGFLHIGGLRTALYNYLFARKNGGKFIFRIEDTDRARAVEGAVENLIKTLKWAGLEYDEGPDKGGPHGPYVQSERLDLYKKYGNELLEKGHAYRCFCTAERLAEMRKDQESHKLAPKYDRRCLNLSKSEIEDLMKKKTPFVVRQNIGERPAFAEASAGRVKGKGLQVGWHDLVRGDVSFNTDDIDDQVLLKSDGFPTYHLANVVDDHAMEISHVIRGEEWLSSTPKHILLYKAFGWKIPEFAHLPLLLNKDKSKLSKRQGDVAVEDYIKKGYLPEAVINFIAFLGWHPGGDETQEIFDMKELIEKFSLEKVHKAGAVFDIEKLDWMNWQWRRKKFEAEVEHDTVTLRLSKGDAEKKRAEKLLDLCKEYIPKEWLKDKDFLHRCLKTVEEKVLQHPQEVQSYTKFYFDDKLSVDPNLIVNPKMKVDAETAKKALSAVLEFAKNFNKFDDQESIKTHMLELVAKLGLKNGQVFWPTRVALTGEQFSPGVFEVLFALGKDKAINRLKLTVQKL